jgi:RNA polymerase sigma-70 factor (sigma-E family)
VTFSRHWRPDAGFDAFVVARMGALLSYAHLITGNRHTAEDVVQAALARTAIAWPGVRDKDNPEGYVRRAIVNEYLNTRRPRRFFERPTAELPEEDAADTAYADSDERDAMWAALRELPPGQRAVLVLRYYEDLSELEIARVLGIAPGTVKSQAAKAMAHLRDQFADREDSTR